MSGDHDHVPGLPPVHDEAPDTPMWVPLLGLGVLVLAALYLVITSALGDEGAPATDDPPPVEQAE